MVARFEDSGDRGKAGSRHLAGRQQFRVARSSARRPRADRGGLRRLKEAGADVILMNPQYAPKVIAKHDAELMVDLISLRRRKPTSTCSSVSP